MSASERIELDDIEQLTAEALAQEARTDDQAAIDLAREVVGLRRLLAACRIARQRLPLRVANELKRFGGYAARTRHNLAEAGRRDGSEA